MGLDVVDLSRLQFAATALYHFLFVPLTLGLAWILVIMESTYVLTGKQIYKDMTQFWGKLFGINFALGVTTGITMEFQFGTNWSQYSHYVGDIFGAPLAIEGLMAFFLEATFVGLFFLGWNRMSKRQHLLVTVLVAVGTNLSALWILVANGWMQYPVGSVFNIETMRMEMTSFAAVFLNPVAQGKFVHTVSAGYVCASMFVLSISSWYLLKGRDVAFAKKSFRIAAAFGIAAVCSVIVLGDDAGFEVAKEQTTKMAAIEGIWDTEKAPASFNLIASPNQQEHKNDWAVKIPWVMGIIGTHSLTQEIPGINNIVASNEIAMKRGIPVLQAVDKYRADRTDMQSLAIVKKYNEKVAKNPEYKYDLGLAMLLKGEVLKSEGKKAGDSVDLTKVSNAQIKAAAEETVPHVSSLFWTFRIMVLFGFLMLVVFALAFWTSVKGNFGNKRWLQKIILCSLPMPWIAIECGWFVAEYGRQPWTIFGILPTNLSASSLSEGTLIASILGFVGFYTILLIVEMFLMIRYAKKGPSSLGTGRYSSESNQQNN